MDRLKARDKLYRYAIIWTVAFTIISCGIMVFFKSNETYFDTYSAQNLRGKDDSRETAESQVRHNIQVNYVDEAGAKFVLPLTQTVSQDHISIREEFVNDKLVITLKGAAACVEAGSQVTSDSDIMEAVGVYRQQEDIVLELYCKDAYAYELTQEQNSLSVSFTPLRDKYDIVSVIYIDPEERNRLSGQDMQTLDKQADKYGMKIFASYQMKDDYTQQEIIDFADHIHADMVLGIGVEQSADCEKIETLCNSEYFIPDFGSVELATIMTDSMSHTYGTGTVSITEADEQCPLVRDATIPAALTIYYTTRDGSERPELEYDLNRKLMNTLADMYEQILSVYATPKG